MLRSLPRIALRASQRSQLATTLPTRYYHASNMVMEDFMNRGGRGRGRGRGTPPAKRAPPPAKVMNDPWVEVKDDASGKMYWWNQDTNETTALGEPKPGEVGAPVEQQSSMGGGLGRVVAEGFAFGVGSSIARSVVGSVFESFGGDASTVDGMFGGEDGGGGDGGGEDWGDEDQWDEGDEL